MRVAILTQSESLYSTRRLAEACAACGLESTCLPILECAVAVGGRRSTPSLLHSGASVPTFDAVLARIGTFMPDLALAQLRVLSGTARVAINSWAATAASRDKVEMTAQLAEAGIPTVPSIYVKDLDGVAAAVDALGGVPIVVKPVSGNQGRGVFRCDRKDGAVSAVQALLNLNRDLLLQPYLECSGKDQRYLVVGDRVVAAIERESAPEDFRSNVHQGGQARAIPIDPAVAQFARHAARVLGLEVAGVDLIQPLESSSGESGPIVLEVNSSPGLEGLEGATQVDAAGAIADRVKELLESSKDVGQSGPRPV